MKVAKNFKEDILCNLLYYQNQKNQKCDYRGYKDIISTIC